jgi:hypothetical protein
VVGLIWVVVWSVFVATPKRTKWLPERERQRILAERHAKNTHLGGGPTGRARDRFANEVIEGWHALTKSPDIRPGAKSTPGVPLVTTQAKSQRIRDRAVMISSTMPSVKYSCSGSPLMF